MHPGCCCSAVGRVDTEQNGGIEIACNAIEGVVRCTMGELRFQAKLQNCSIILFPSLALGTKLSVERISES